MFIKNIHQTSLGYIKKFISLKCTRNIRTSGVNHLRFVQFINNNGTQSLGILTENGSNVLDLSNADSNIPNNLVQFLEKYNETSDNIKK